MHTKLTMLASKSRRSNRAHHEPGQGRKHIDRWVDLSVVELTIYIDLAFSNVASQVWNGVGDVIIGHGKNGQLGDGALTPLNAPSPLIDGC